MAISRRIDDVGQDNRVYKDERFGLLQGPSETFLNFLCEMVHPDVRPDRAAAIALVRKFNERLRPDGWALVEERFGPRPRYKPQRIQAAGARAVSRAKEVVDFLDDPSLQKKIRRIEKAIEDDPELAVGSAKDLVEGCCKAILDAPNVDAGAAKYLPALTKLLVKELKLLPEDIPDKAKGSESIRLILRNLSTVTQHLAELRNLYGTGHGRNGTRRGLQPRHARLAVGAAVVFIEFVTETHRERGTTERIR